MGDERGLRAAAGEVAKTSPDIWRAYAALGAQCAQAGPNEGGALRLAKLA